SASATPPAMVAAHSGTAAAMATGRPRATSVSARTAHGCDDEVATGATAGKMHAAKASAMTARAGAGRARSPNAGTSVTAGVTRAHASPRAPRSTPERAKA